MTANEKEEKTIEITGKSILAVVITVVSLSVLAGLAIAAQDRFTLKAPNGVAVSDFKGYSTWQDVSVSQTENGIKAILANPVMIFAYKQGIPGNGKPFPDGSMIVKIEWTRRQNTVSPFVVPDTLKSISFIEKDSRRFSDTGGWGHAQFLYDASSDTFTPFENNASFAQKVCYPCYTQL